MGRPKIKKIFTKKRLVIVLPLLVIAALLVGAVSSGSPLQVDATGQIVSIFGIPISGSGLLSFEASVALAVNNPLGSEPTRVSYSIGDKEWVNTWTETEYLGDGKYGTTIHGGHQVFFDEADGNKPKKHKLTDNRPDYIVVQSAQVCAEIHPFYTTFYDVQYQEVRLEEERWIVQRLFKAPDTWRDVDSYSPVMAVEEVEDALIVTTVYDTDYGILTVEYFQRGGNALKRNITFKNTSGTTQTFRVFQRWTGIVGGKCNGKDFPLVTDEPVLKFRKADGKLSVAENLRSVIFNPDGSEKAAQCLKRPISIEAHPSGMKADFIYGNWVLAQNESLEIDPATVTLDSPTEDGCIHRTEEFCPELFEKIGKQWHSIGYAWISSLLEDEKTVFHNVKSPNLQLMEHHDPYSEINCLSMLSGSKENSLKSVEVLYDVNLRSKPVEEIIQVIHPLPCYEERLRNHLSLPHKGMLSNEEAMKYLSKIDNQRVVILRGERIKFSFNDGTDLQLCITGWSDAYIYTRYSGEDKIYMSPTDAGYVEWNVSGIPDEATIIDTIFKYHTSGGSYEDSTIREMVGHRPSTSTDQEVYDEAGEGTIYIWEDFPIGGSNKSVDLGTDADTDLKNLLPSDWFAIGFRGSNLNKIYSSEYASADPKPTLYVEYTLPEADISNTPGSKDFGVVAEGATPTTGLGFFTVTNNSSGAITITIQGTDMTGTGTDWDLSDDGTAGTDVVGIKAGLEGGDYTIVVKEDGPYNTLKAGLADEATQKWGLKLYIPTSITTKADTKTGTVTLTATCD